RVSTSSNKFKCSVCNYKAAQAQDVEHHESKFHSSSNKKYNCSKCTETFSSKVSLSDHILRIHKFRKCPTCELQIPFSQFDNHLQRSRCGKCNANFKCSGDRQKHQQNCKPVIQKCEICSKVFKFKHLLGYHMNEEHAGVKMIKGARFRNRGFECKICTNYYFKNRKSLDMHIKIKHSGNHQKLQCAHCSKKFAFKYSLSKHLQNTHNLAVKKFRCEPCNKHFFHNSYLKSHIMKVHSKERITCEFCDKILKTLQLKNHLRKFHGKY
ncbi:zinc finger protein 224-like, partial [Neocloeon triangulifer]|uniref:zinc finger protein 224-like n=1 Tax=Neocloeon triangulifer TaxID=2078957 RepID=UPI00286F83B4